MLDDVSFGQYRYFSEGGYKEDEDENVAWKSIRVLEKIYKKVDSNTDEYMVGDIVYLAIESHDIINPRYKKFIDDDCVRSVAVSLSRIDNPGLLQEGDRMLYDLLEYMLRKDAFGDPEPGHSISLATYYLNDLDIKPKKQ